MGGRPEVVRLMAEQMGCPWCGALDLVELGPLPSRPVVMYRCGRCERDCFLEPATRQVFRDDGKALYAGSAR